MDKVGGKSLKTGSQKAGRKDDDKKDGRPKSSLKKVQSDEKVKMDVEKPL